MLKTEDSYLSCAAGETLSLFSSIWYKDLVPQCWETREGVKKPRKLFSSFLFWVRSRWDWNFLDLTLWGWTQARSWVSQVGSVTNTHKPFAVCCNLLGRYRLYYTDIPPMLRRGSILSQGEAPALPCLGQVFCIWPRCIALPSRHWLFWAPFCIALRHYFSPKTRGLKCGYDGTTPGIIEDLFEIYWSSGGQIPSFYFKFFDARWGLLCFIDLLILNKKRALCTLFSICFSFSLL